MTIKLSDTQLVLLSAAAQRHDHCLVAPQHLKGGAAKKVADKLIGVGLVREIKAKTDVPVWRRDEEEGHDYTLKLTAAGLEAIAVDVQDAAEPASDSAVPAESEPRASRGHPKNPDVPHKKTTVQNPRATEASPREGSKLANVIDLLERRRGATLEELIATTDWLPHTIRAALTGLRKRGFNVILDRSDKARGSVYRIEVLVEQAAA